MTTAVEPGESLLDARRRLEAEQQDAEARRRARWEGLGRPARAPEPEPEYETTWSGGEGLSSYAGGSSLPRR